MSFTTEKNYLRGHIVSAVLVVLFGLICGLNWSFAQRTRTPGVSTGFDDVVFAISFSPDGRSLAIARGAGEPSQRFGRIELWDPETGTLRRVIKGFDGPVRSISFSPDGQTLISGSSEYHTAKIQEKAREREGTIQAELKWWNAKTGELNHSLTLPGEGNTSLLATYTPDGKQVGVVAGYMEMTWLTSNSLFVPPSSIDPFPSRFTSFPRMTFRADFKLLDAETGEPKVKLNTAVPGRLIFSPDGMLMAIDTGSEIKLRNTQTGAEVQKLKDLKGRVSAMVFSPDSQTLVVAITRFDRSHTRHFIIDTGKSEVRLFDVHTWKVTRKLQNLGLVNSLAFEPAGRGLLIGGMINDRDTAVPAVKVVDLRNGTAANFRTGAVDLKQAVGSLAISPDGGLLALLSGRDTVQLVNTQTWRLMHTWDATSVGDSIERPASRFLLSVKRVLAVAFSSDSKTLSGETDQGEIKLWDPRTGEIKNEPSVGQDDPSLVAVSSDGKSFAEVSNAQLLIWSATDGKKKQVPVPAGHPIAAIALSGNGQTLAVGSGDNVIVINAAGEVARTLAGSVSHLAFADDGQALAVVDEAGSIKIWNLSSGQIEKQITTRNEIKALCFSPRGQLLATAGPDHSITIWNWRTGLSQQRLQKHDAEINALAFSADGRFLASGGDDRMVVIWDVAAGKSRHTLKGHDQTVTSVAFSPDGLLLASGSGNASVALWEVKSGKLSRVLR